MVAGFSVGFIESSPLPSPDPPPGWGLWKWQITSPDCPLPKASIAPIRNVGLQFLERRAWNSSDRTSTRWLEGGYGDLPIFGDEVIGGRCRVGCQWPRRTGCPLAASASFLKPNDQRGRLSGRATSLVTHITGSRGQPWNVTQMPVPNRTLSVDRVSWWPGSTHSSCCGSRYVIWAAIWGVFYTLGGVLASVAGQRRGLWRSRWAAVGAAVAVTLGGGGMSRSTRRRVRRHR